MFSAPPDRPHRRKRVHQRLLAGGAGMVVVTGLVMVPTSAGADESLPDLVTTKNIQDHLNSLQDVADNNDGNRADGTSGYDASADYVIDQLEQAGYSPEKHTYEFERWTENSDSVLSQTAPDQRDFAHEDDFVTLTYSGAGDVTAQGVPVSPDAEDSGCSAEEFSDFPEGAVAIMRRGTCDFEEKATNAADAGAEAAVIFNQGGDSEQDSGPINGTLSNPMDIPVVGASTEVGEDLAAVGDDLEVRVAVDSEVGTATSYSVIAESGGAEDSTVMVGSHLDSVQEGAGINDNGSGVGAILETAIQLSTLEDPANQVRFAFWGTEEEGLVGSTEYVNELSDQERENIAMYLNFDMIGSPNYARFVYDGRGELEESMPPPAGSAEIQQLFEDYFADQDLESEPTELGGTSDYAPFIEAGIPSGGVFSGAGDVKTEEQAERHGGTAGEPFDANYHTADDDIDNINETAVTELSGGIAHAVQTYANGSLSETTALQDQQDVSSDRQGDLWLR